MKRLPIIVILFWLTLSQAQLTVVASLHPYYSLLEHLVLEDANVIRLLPPGASPHTFDPTPRDVARLAEADLVVLNGGLDEWLNDLVAASGREVTVAEVLELVPFTPLAGQEADEHASVNPHVWLDPRLMIELVPELSLRLSELDPANAEDYEANAQALIADLTALDKELEEMLRPVKDKAFVPFHDAWPYFARRYGLNLVVEIEPAPGREPSPRYLSEALSLIAESGAEAVFSEVQLPTRPAEVVADNAGVPLYLLDPIGGGDTTESYHDLLRHNAQVIADALLE